MLTATMAAPASTTDSALGGNGRFREGAAAAGLGGVSQAALGARRPDAGVASPWGLTDAASCRANSPADGQSSAKARRSTALPPSPNAATGTYRPFDSTRARGPPNAS